MLVECLGVDDDVSGSEPSRYLCCQCMSSVRKTTICLLPSNERLVVAMYQQLGNSDCQFQPMAKKPHLQRLPLPISCLTPLSQLSAFPSTVPYSNLHTPKYNKSVASEAHRHLGHRAISS